ANGVDSLSSPPVPHDDNWHWLVLSHRFLPGETTLFLDGIRVGSVRESRIPRQFIVGPAGCHDAVFRNLLIFRAALSDDESVLISRGKLWRGSLEVYAPLGVPFGPAAPVANLAQSNSTVLSYAENPTAALAAIEEKIKITERQRLNEKIFPEKTAIELPQEKLACYAGVYEINPGDRISVEWQNGAFWIIDQGRKQDIYPESPERFFIKHPQLEIEIRFAGLQNGRYSGLQMTVNGRVQIQARRLDPPTEVKE
ncbi:MAG: hypothetical protein L0Y36_10590, partial [Planctomycetales bacterium]|nr:hypothetical protein [Planctomycetales bacterium]